MAAGMAKEAGAEELGTVELASAAAATIHRTGGEVGKVARVRGRGP